MIDVGRKRVGSITASVVIGLVNNLHAQEVCAIDQYGLMLVPVQFVIHNDQEILQTFAGQVCGNMVEVPMLPDHSAKPRSTVDNALFHN